MAFGGGIRVLWTLFLVYLFFAKKKKYKKIEFHEKCKKNTVDRWCMLMQIIVVKFTLYVTENAPKNHRFIAWQNTGNF